MSVWNPFRKAKKAGQRVLDRMDEVEREARSGDIDAEARRMVFQSSETELEGGVGALAELGLDENEELELLEVDESSDGLSFAAVDALFEEDDTSNSFFADLQPQQRQPVDEDDFNLEDARDLTQTGELTATGENTATAELTATGERTHSLRPDWANSLGFDTQELTKILRFDHYPQLSEQPVQLLIALSRYEQSLMHLGEELGRACYVLLRDVLPKDEDWEAAVWTTGAHWDHAVRSALAGMEQDEGPVNSRTLGWAFWPFTDELLSAAVGLKDPCGISELIAKIERVLDERWVHVSGGHDDLEAEGDHLPILPRGLFAFEGFRWEA